MTKEEEKEKLRFRFASEDDLFLTRGGKFKCNLCDHYFVVPEIDITLHWFTLCPSCILSGPAAVAAEAKRYAADKDRINRVWKYTDSRMDRIDAAGIAGQYRVLARSLRGVKSFEEIQGGSVAMAIAAVRADHGSRRFKPKTATIIKVPLAFVKET